MKREEIVCIRCNDKSEERLKGIAIEYNEPFNIELGVLIKDGLVCDACNVSLITGKPAVCRSWAGPGQQLRKWEADFIRPMTNEEAFLFSVGGSRATSRPTQ